MFELALRVGFSQYNSSDKIGNCWTAGVGLKIGPLQLDCAYAPHQTLGETYRVSLGLRFAAAPPPAVTKPPLKKPVVVAPAKPEVAPGRVAKITDQTLYINLGFAQGVKLGDKFIVYRVTSVIDPLTKEVIGTTEEEVGVVEVIKVEKKMSLARILKGCGSNQSR